MLLLHRVLWCFGSLDLQLDYFSPCFVGLLAASNLDINLDMVRQGKEVKLGTWNVGITIFLRATAGTQPKEKIKSRSSIVPRPIILLIHTPLSSQLN